MDTGEVCKILFWADHVQYRLQSFLLDFGDYCGEDGVFDLLVFSALYFIQSVLFSQLSQREKNNDVLFHHVPSLYPICSSFYFSDVAFSTF